MQNSLAQKMKILTKNAFNEYRKSLKQLKSLILDQTFWVDCELLGKMVPKIAIRLRNSIYSRALIQLYKLTRKLRSFFQEFGAKNYDEILNCKPPIDPYIEEIETIALHLFKICTVSTKSFNHCQVWFELDHLASHFLIISGLVSRICIFSKAFMVYVYDLYFVLLRIDATNEPKPDRVIKYLKRMNIKLRKSWKTLATPKQPAKISEAIVETKDPEEEEEEENVNNTDFGVPINRKHFEQTSLCLIENEDGNQKKLKRKKKGRKKSKSQIEKNTKKLKKERAKNKVPVDQNRGSKKKKNEKLRTNRNRFQVTII